MIGLSISFLKLGIDMNKITPYVLQLLIAYWFRCLARALDGLHVCRKLSALDCLDNGSSFSVCSGGTV